HRSPLSPVDRLPLALRAGRRFPVWPPDRSGRRLRSAGFDFPHLRVRGSVSRPFVHERGARSSRSGGMAGCGPRGALGDRCLRKHRRVRVESVPPVALTGISDHGGSMKTSLEHLPAYKREELARVVELILAAGKPEILILFGSHARGDWVEDRRVEGNHITEYRSDYDLYALTRIAKHCDRLLLEPSLRRRFDEVSRTPVSLIADTVKHFNESLERGRYFYVDVYKEGIVLHNSGRYALSAPRELSREEQWEEANANYDYWFDRAESFFRMYQAMLEQDRITRSAFQLHQAVEHCTTTILLVLTGYTPKGHDIARRLQQCAGYDRRFG